MATFKTRIQPSRSLARRFAIGPREVLVFDELFPLRTTRLLYEELRQTSFRWGARDSPSRAHAHAVRWKKDIPLRAAEIPFFTDIAELVTRLTGDRRLVLDRIYVNYNLYGEVHLPHVDAKRGVTALFCANVEWQPAWQGETFFYEDDEPTHVVLPRPGRLIVFDAALKHRGSPPSRDCYEPRINIAFKFQHARGARSRTQRVGVVRRYG